MRKGRGWGKCGVGKGCQASDDRIASGLHTPAWPTRLDFLRFLFLFFHSFPMQPPPPSPVGGISTSPSLLFVLDSTDQLLPAGWVVDLGDGSIPIPTFIQDQFICVLTTTSTSPTTMPSDKDDDWIRPPVPTSPCQLWMRRDMVNRLKDQPPCYSHLGTRFDLMANTIQDSEVPSLLFAEELKKQGCTSAYLPPPASLRSLMKRLQVSIATNQAFFARNLALELWNRNVCVVLTCLLDMSLKEGLVLPEYMSPFLWVWTLSILDPSHPCLTWLVQQKYWTTWLLAWVDHLACLQTKEPLHQSLIHISSHDTDWTATFPVQTLLPLPHILHSSFVVNTRLSVTPSSPLSSYSGERSEERNWILILYLWDRLWHEVVSDLDWPSMVVSTTPPWPWTGLTEKTDASTSADLSTIMGLFTNIECDAAQAGHQVPWPWTKSAHRQYLAHVFRWNRPLHVAVWGTLIRRCAWVWFKRFTVARTTIADEFTRSIPGWRAHTLRKATSVNGTALWGSKEILDRYSNFNYEAYLSWVVGRREASMPCLSEEEDGGPSHEDSTSSSIQALPSYFRSMIWLDRGVQQVMWSQYCRISLHALRLVESEVEHQKLKSSATRKVTSIRAPAATCDPIHLTADGRVHDLQYAVRTTRAPLVCGRPRKVPLSDPMTTNKESDSPVLAPISAPETEIPPPLQPRAILSTFPLVSPLVVTPKTHADRSKILYAKPTELRPDQLVRSPHYSQSDAKLSTDHPACPWMSIWTSSFRNFIRFQAPMALSATQKMPEDVWPLAYPLTRETIDTRVCFEAVRKLRSISPPQWREMALPSMQNLFFPMSAETLTHQSDLHIHPESVAIPANTKRSAFFAFVQRVRQLACVDTTTWIARTFSFPTASPRFPEMHLRELWKTQLYRLPSPLPPCPLASYSPPSMNLHPFLWYQGRCTRLYGTLPGLSSIYACQSPAAGPVFMEYRILSTQHVLVGRVDLLSAAATLWLSMEDCAALWSCALFSDTPCWRTDVEFIRRCDAWLSHDPMYAHVAGSYRPMLAQRLLGLLLFVQPDDAASSSSSSSSPTDPCLVEGGLWFQRHGSEPTLMPAQKWLPKFSTHPQVFLNPPPFDALDPDVVIKGKQQDLLIQWQILPPLANTTTIGKPVGRALPPPLLPPKASGGPRPPAPSISPSRRPPPLLVQHPLPPKVAVPMVSQQPTPGAVAAAVDLEDQERQAKMEYKLLTEKNKRMPKWNGLVKGVVSTSKEELMLYDPQPTVVERKSEKKPSSSSSSLTPVARSHQFQIHTTQACHTLILTLSDWVRERTQASITKPFLTGWIRCALQGFTDVSLSATPLAMGRMHPLRLDDMSMDDASTLVWVKHLHFFHWIVRVQSIVQDDTDQRILICKRQSFSVSAPTPLPAQTQFVWTWHPQLPSVFLLELATHMGGICKSPHTPIEVQASLRVWGDLQFPPPLFNRHLQHLLAVYYEDGQTNAFVEAMGIWIQCVNLCLDSPPASLPITLWLWNVSDGHVDLTPLNAVSLLTQKALLHLVVLTSMHLAPSVMRLERQPTTWSWTRSPGATTDFDSILAQLRIQVKRLFYTCRFSAPSLHWRRWIADEVPTTSPPELFFQFPPPSDLWKTFWVDQPPSSVLPSMLYCVGSVARLSKKTRSPVEEEWEGEFTQWRIDHMDSLLHSANLLTRHPQRMHVEVWYEMWIRIARRLHDRLVIHRPLEVVDWMRMVEQCCSGADGATPDPTVLRFLAFQALLHSMTARYDNVWWPSLQDWVTNALWTMLMDSWMTPPPTLPRVEIWVPSCDEQIETRVGACETTQSLALLLAARVFLQNATSMARECVVHPTLVVDYRDCLFHTWIPVIASHGLYRPLTVIVQFTSTLIFVKPSEENHFRPASRAWVQENMGSEVDLYLVSLELLEQDLASQLSFPVLQHVTDYRNRDVMNARLGNLSYSNIAHFEAPRNAKYFAQSSHDEDVKWLSLQPDQNEIRAGFPVNEKAMDHLWLWTEWFALVLPPSIVSRWARGMSSPATASTAEASSSSWSIENQSSRSFLSMLSRRHTWVWPASATDLTTESFRLFLESRVVRLRAPAYYWNIQVRRWDSLTRPVTLPSPNASFWPQADLNGSSAWFHYTTPATMDSLAWTQTALPVWTRDFLFSDEPSHAVLKEVCTVVHDASSHALDATSGAEEGAWHFHVAWTRLWTSSRSPEPLLNLIQAGLVGLNKDRFYEWCFMQQTLPLPGKGHTYLAAKGGFIQPLYTQAVGVYRPMAWMDDPITKLLRDAQPNQSRYFRYMRRTHFAALVQCWQKFNGDMHGLLPPTWWIGASSIPFTEEADDEAGPSYPRPTPPPPSSSSSSSKQQPHTSSNQPSFLTGYAFVDGIDLRLVSMWMARMLFTDEYEQTREKFLSLERRYQLLTAAAASSSSTSTSTKRKGKEVEEDLGDETDSVDMVDEDDLDQTVEEKGLKNSARRSQYAKRLKTSKPMFTAPPLPRAHTPQQPSLSTSTFVAQLPHPTDEQLLSISSLEWSRTARFLDQVGTFLLVTRPDPTRPYDAYTQPVGESWKRLKEAQVEHSYALDERGAYWSFWTPSPLMIRVFQTAIATRFQAPSIGRLLTRSFVWNFQHTMDKLLKSSSSIEESSSSTALVELVALPHLFWANTFRQFSSRFTRSVWFVHTKQQAEFVWSQWLPWMGTSRCGLLQIVLDPTDQHVELTRATPSTLYPSRPAMRIPLTDTARLEGWFQRLFNRWSSASFHEENVYHHDHVIFHLAAPQLLSLAHGSLLSRSDQWYYLTPPSSPPRDPNVHHRQVLRLLNTYASPWMTHTKYVVVVPGGEL